MLNQNSFKRFTGHALMAILCLVSCFSIYGQAKHTPLETGITKTLESQFSENVTFVHRELEEEMASDSLTYKFYNASTTTVGDSLFLCYVQRIKGYDTLVTVEKIEQVIPISCIEEVDIFNFTFGATDTFEPPLSYIGFWMKHENCSKREVYGIDPTIWNAGNVTDADYELIETDHPYVARFPVTLSEALLDALRTEIKVLQKQKK